MCRCAAFIVKYTLIIANIVFALAGITLIGLGVAVHLQVKDIAELVPAILNGLSIAIIVLGCVVFIISYLACCGAIRESRCMLIFYSIFMSILAAVKIYIVVVIFNFLDNVTSTVQGWIVSAFNNMNVREAFHVMETMFKCCGTSGSGSYVATSAIIPPSCCANPLNNQCPAQDSYDGCNAVVSDYFKTFGEAIGSVIVVVIIVEIVCVIFGSFLSYRIKRNKRLA